MWCLRIWNTGVSMQRNRPTDQTGGKTVSPIMEVINTWQTEHVEKLKEIHQLRYDSRTSRTELEQEILTFLNAYIEALDDFDSMINTIENSLGKDEKKAKRVLANFKTLRKRFVAVLKQFSVAPIAAPEASEFISGLHKAVGVEFSRSIENGNVIRITKQGFFWKNKILRPAEVVVATSEGTEIQEEET